MSKWVFSNQPCPCGKSSAYAEDKEGNGFCFSGTCNKFFKNKEEAHIEDINPDDCTYEYYPSRGVSYRTLEFYDIKTKLYNGIPIETGYHYPNQGFKFRRHGDDVKRRERFYQTDGMGNPGLYGKHCFDPGSKESITICEGMHDAPSVYEMTGGRTAAVAVTSSGQALRDIQKDRDYVNSFAKIYICMDNDPAGEDATREIVSSGIFDYNKVYIVKYHHFKDPNEYLTNGKVDEFVTCWKNARRYSPDNIISTFAEIEKSLELSEEDQIGTYPFKVLNQNLYGIHKGEVIVIKAPEGVGKTEFFRATEYHNLQESQNNIGIIHLEEDNGTTVKAIAGYQLEVPATLPDCGLGTKEIMDGYRKAVRDNEGRIHIYSSFETEDESILYDNIRFLTSVAKCKIIFLDHISWLATGLADEDERKKLDRISQKLKLLAKELGFAIIEISHVNDDGKTRGSRNISKVANTVISLSRDNLSHDPVMRNRTFFTIEKARLGGRTGAAGYADFNAKTGKLEDMQAIS